MLKPALFQTIDAGNTDFSFAGSVMKSKMMRTLFSIPTLCSAVCITSQSSLPKHVASKLIESNSIPKYQLLSKNKS